MAATRIGLGLQLQRLSRTATRTSFFRKGAIDAARPTRSSLKTGLPKWGLGLASTLGMGTAAALFSAPVLCQGDDDKKPSTTRTTSTEPPPPASTANAPKSAANAPKSAANSPNEEPTPGSGVPSLSHLTLPAILGIGTGIFLVKGLKFAGFFIGAGFILIQYLNSRGFIPGINWRGAEKSWEGWVDKTFPEKAEKVAKEGEKELPKGWRHTRLGRIAGAGLDFLLADFPARSTFLAGLALGVRLG